MYWESPNTDFNDIIKMTTVQVLMTHLSIYYTRLIGSSSRAKERRKLKPMYQHKTSVKELETKKNKHIKLKQDSMIRYKSLCWHYQILKQ